MDERTCEFHFKATPERGIALILVVLVLTALVAIGTPFAISMKLHERGSFQYTAREEANLAVTSARNHAVAQLFSTHPSREREASERNSVPGDKFDGLDELEVEFDTEFTTVPVQGSDSPQLYTMHGSGNQTLDARVEDEQGKININTAMPNLIGNLLAGSHLARNISYTEKLDELPLDDTTSFPSDGDPDTIDGVVVILNPLFFTVEALSYTGKTETGLTGVFRGQYLSGTWEHQKGWPVFDIRGLKVFLHRYYNLSDGEIDTFRTPMGIRQIADWSVVPYFLQTMAVFGLNVRNMSDFGLTPEMLVRAGLDQALLKRSEEEVDESEYRDARRKLLKVGIPREAVDMVESFRGKAAVIQVSEIADRFDLQQAQANAFKGVFSTFIKAEMARMKIHSRTYFPKAIEAFKVIYDIPSMETFDAADYELIRDLITTESSIPRLWSQEQLVEDRISTSAIVGVPSFRLGRYDFFNPGTLVRVRSISDPSKVEYVLAAGAFPTPRGGFRGLGRGAQSIFQGGVILKEPLKNEYGPREALVSAMLRHPININTANRKVIAAVLTGISTERFSRNFNSVTVSEARELADLLVEAAPIQDFGQFRLIISDAQSSNVIDGNDASAILLNAADPNHPRLSISTTGFCYSTGDVYTIESSSVVRNSAGVSTAGVHLREIVEVAPPDQLFLELSNQDDWSAVVYRRAASRRGGRNDSVFLPGRAMNLMATSPVPLNRTPWESPSLVEGSLRGVTIESQEVSQNRGVGLPIAFGDVEHFPETIEGHDLSQGVYTANTLQQQQEQQRNSRRRGPPVPTPEPNVPQDITTLPGMVEFWYRPQWGGRSGLRVIFDSLADPTRPFQNRVRLYFDGDDSSLVLQVMDDALIAQIPASGNQLPAAAEIRHQVTPQSFADDTWYHITAIWKSTRPGDQGLLIDRRLVGRSSWVTRLSSPFSVNGGRLNVEDSEIAERFPPVGTLLVGSEAIDYTGRQGTTFQVRAPGPGNEPPIGRGARGTVRQQHPRGTPVRLLGYSVDIASADERVSLEVQGDQLLLGSGGAKLAIDLPATKRYNRLLGLLPSTYATIEQGDFSAEMPYPLGANDPMIVVQAEDVTPTALGFPPHGYIHVQYRTRLASGVIRDGIWEYAKYSSIVPGPEPGMYQFVGLGRGLLGSQPVDISDVEAGIHQIVVTSVSIETDASNLDLTYPPSGVVQIDRGLGATSQTAPPDRDVEWIRYTAIAEGKFFIASPHDNLPFRGYTGNRRVSTSSGLLRGRSIWDEKEVLDHNSGQEVAQVIRAINPLPGIGDIVTVAESFGDPLSRLSESKPLLIRKVREIDVGVFISFWDTPVNAYYVRGNPKLKKFPSGDLPAIASGQMVFGSSAISGQGGSAPGTIDEVRFSRCDAGDADIIPFPIAGNGGVILDAVPPPPNLPEGVKTRVIRPWYRASDGVDGGSNLDKLLLVGRSRLEAVTDAAGNVVGRTFNAGHPRSFGMGRSEGIFVTDGEAMHYTFEAGDIESAVLVDFEQNLPRDGNANDDEETLPDGTDRVIDPARDLRTEVIPEIRVNDTSKIPPRNGFLEVISDPGKEVLFYESASSGILRNVLRGQLGTPVGSYVYSYDVITGAGGTETRYNIIRTRLLATREVDLRTRSMLGSERLGNALAQNSLVPLPTIPVTRINAPISDQILPVLNARNFPSSLGYCLFDDGNPATADEIIAYWGRSDEEFNLYRDDRTGRGIFRGRFGTPASEVPFDTPVVYLPVRYHDHYQPFADSPDFQYLERAFTIPGAHWDSVSWELSDQGNPALHVEVRVLARFDGEPRWDEKPTNRPGGLFLFDNPRKENLIDVESDLLELRVCYRYPTGSYGRDSSNSVWRDDWKHQPALETLTIEYRKPWRVVHREELAF